MTKTLKVPQTLFRAATIQSEGEGKDRKFRMSISSDTPYKRYDWWNDEEYYEVLDHSPGGMDETRLKAGLPILFNHQRDAHLARATSYANSGSKCEVGDFIWSESQLAKEKRADAESGALPDTSVGYQIADEGECIGAKDGLPIYKFKWAPYEGSLVTIPADISVGVGRQRDHKPDGEPKEISIKGEKSVDSTRTNENTSLNSEKTMSEPASPATLPEPAKIDVVKERADAAEQALGAAQARIDKIDGWIEALPKPQWKEAATEIAKGYKKLGDKRSFDEFRAEALNKFESVSRVETPTAEIGMSQKDLQRYSLARAIYLRGMGRPLDGIEKEASDATAKKIRKDPDGFFIPEDYSVRSLQEIHGISQRTLLAGNFTSAGALIGVDLLTGSLIELLRNKQVFGSLGITTLSGLTGNIAIPRQSGGATAYWLAEGGSVTASDQAFQQLGLTPHRLVAQTAYDKQLVAQASLSVEAIVRNDIALVMAIKKDLAILIGTGVGGEPLGIYNTTGVQTVTFSTTATLAKVIEFETDLATANADQTGVPVFVTSPAVRGKWKSIARASNYPSFLWENDMVNGYRGAVSNQVSATAAGAVPANAVYFGVPSEIIDAIWAGIDVVVNPFSLDSTGQIRTTITQWCDVGLRHAPAWIVSTDTGAA